MKNIAICVIPAVEKANFNAVRHLAHEYGDAYALGIHPLYVRWADEADLALLDAELGRYRDDPRLVAVGEVGLDYFVPALCEEPLASRQEYFYREQLKLARKHGLPVIVHVRRSADRLLKHLREIVVSGGIAHAFNGSEQQARAFLGLGFKLGFGGAVTFERATRLRTLARSLPLDALVMETDAPDMAPHWLYKTAQERAAGAVQGVNTPDQLPRIAQVVAGLRGIDVTQLARATTQAALQALPRLGALL